MKDSAYSYSRSQTELMKKICEPLKIFGVQCVHYVRMFKDGKFLVLSNQEDFAYNMIFDIKKGHIFNGMLIQTNSDVEFYLWPEAPKSEAETIFSKTGWHGLGALRIKPQYAEFWGFSTSFTNERMKKIYYRHINIFTHFIKILDAQLLNELEVSEQIDLNKLSFVEMNLTIPWEKSELKAKELEGMFLQSLYPKGIEVNSKNGRVRLSNREIDCLKLIRDGKRVKEVALELKISHRTVDKFIANIHNKTGYNSNSQLVKLYDDQLAEIINILKSTSS